jgi:hypothetical protein
MKTLEAAPGEEDALKDVAYLIAFIERSERGVIK